MGINDLWEKSKEKKNYFEIHGNHQRKENTFLSPLPVDCD